ncbi:MAG: ATP-binding cassette domain-containing protein, partial [Paracoccaceae bacterium]
MSMLSVSDLVTHYGHSQALYGVNLSLDAGEVVTLLGRNGMGKTTTINSIMGIVQKTSGRVQFEGTDISSFPSYKVAKLGIGLVPEGRQIFPLLTVRENLLATAANRHNLSSAWDLQKVYDLFPILQNRRDQL